MSVLPLEVRRLHDKMFNELDMAIEQDDLGRLKRAARGHLGWGDISRCPGVLDVLKRLEISGKVEPGEYTTIKQILGDAALGEALKIVLNYERCIAGELRISGTPKVSSHDSPSGSLEAGNCSSIREESDLYRSYCKKKTSSFVQTTTYTKAEHSLKNNSSLLLIGGSGDGKSSILHYLAANSDYLPIQCCELNDVDICTKSPDGRKENFLFVFDDLFGGSYTHYKQRDKWVHKSKKLLKYLDLHKFIFAIRDTVWEDCKLYLDSNKLFCNVVKVTSAELTTEDKRGLLLLYLAESTKLTQEMVNNIVNNNRPIAYCQCCKLMGDAIQKGESAADLAKIFQRPFAFLCKELQIIADKDKAKYATLCLVMLCRGKLKSEQLATTVFDATSDVRERIEAVSDVCGCPNLSCGDIQRSAEKLTGTFLDKGTDARMGILSCEVYSFSHNSIHEALIMEYGKHHFRHCLKFLHSDAIVEMVRPYGYKKGEQEFAIPVPADYYSEVATVFTDKAIGGNWDLRAVFDNPCVQDVDFQQFWCEYLKSCPNKLTDFCQSEPWIGQCAWHLAGMSGARGLWSLIQNLQNGGSDKCRCCADSNSPCETDALMASGKHISGQAYEVGRFTELEHILSPLSSERRDETIDRALEYACLHGKREIVQYLLNNHYDSDSEVKCAWERGLKYASMNAQIDIVHFLLGRGANINTTYENGQTCLHLSAGLGHNDTVRCLLTKGADIDITDKDGCTGIHVAVENGHTDTVRHFVTQGADISKTDSRGANCLYRASEMGHADIVRYLVTQGADMNKTDSDGMSCLHRAVSNSHRDIVSYLATQGADVNIRDKWDRTAMKIAVDEGDIDIVEMFARHQPVLDKHADSFCVII